MHGVERSHPGISENAWAEFSSKFKKIDIILTLLYAYEAVELLQLSILRRSMPVTHLRVLFCNFVSIFLSLKPNRHFVFLQCNINIFS